MDTKYDYVQDIINSKIKMGSGALFSWGIAEDDKNSSNNILQVRATTSDKCEDIWTDLTTFKRG